MVHQMTAEAVGLFIEHHAVSAHGAAQRRLHACHAAADDGHLLGAFRRGNAQLLGALELHGVGHALAVVAGVGEQVQVLGNGHTAAVVHAVVAAQAGADVVFTAFLGLPDEFGIRHGVGAQAQQMEGVVHRGGPPVIGAILVGQLLDTGAVHVRRVGKDGGHHVVLRQLVVLGQLHSVYRCR